MTALMKVVIGIMCIGLEHQFPCHHQTLPLTAYVEDFY
jgi:hypothetical protein